MSTARAPQPELELGCVLALETGVLVVLTEGGPVRATYDARMLGAIARDRSNVPAPGEWVTLHSWCDGPQTVVAALTRPSEPALAEVLPWRARRPRAGRRHLED